MDAKKSATCTRARSKAAPIDQTSLEIWRTRTRETTSGRARRRHNMGERPFPVGPGVLCFCGAWCRRAAAPPPDAPMGANGRISHVRQQPCEHKQLCLPPQPMALTRPAAFMLGKGSLVISAQAVEIKLTRVLFKNRKLRQR